MPRLLAAGAVLLVLGGGAWLVLRDRAPDAPAAPPTSPIETLVARWHADGAVPRGPPLDPVALVRKGRALLASDRPDAAAEAVATFRAALAEDPSRPDALAGWVVAFADAAGAEVEAEALRSAHEAMEWARARHPGRADLLAAWTRLLLLVPSASNQAEARVAAERAVAADPGNADARLARGLVLVGADPSAAARELEAAAAAHPADRRLLTAAARARWAAWDAPAALALADRRLALDADHAASLALRADVLSASDRLEDARAALRRWAAAAPRDARPRVEEARILYQLEGDLGAARTLLDEARRLAAAEDFLTARVLGHRAALERAAGDEAAAQVAVAEALRRVPASAVARYQAGLLAATRGDVAALREAAGTLGARGGPLPAARLAALLAEHAGTVEEAEAAWNAVAALAPRDPSVVLEAAGALARSGATGPALALAARAAKRDPVEAGSGACRRTSGPAARRSPRRRRGFSASPRRSRAAGIGRSPRRPPASSSSGARCRGTGSRRRPRRPPRSARCLSRSARRWRSTAPGRARPSRSRRRRCAASRPIRLRSPCAPARSSPPGARPPRRGRTRTRWRSRRISAARGSRSRGSTPGSGIRSRPAPISRRSSGRIRAWPPPAARC
jgi:tetratricopeptide (TPR) repeat protein